MTYRELRRRAKLVCMDEQFLLEVFNWASRPPDMLALPQHESLPDDAFVDRVWIEQSSRQVQFLVLHESFEEVLPGHEPERIYFNDNVRHVAFSQIVKEASEDGDTRRTSDDSSRDQSSLADHRTTSQCGTGDDAQST